MAEPRHSAATATRLVAATTAHLAATTPALLAAPALLLAAACAGDAPGDLARGGDVPTWTTIEDLRIGSVDHPVYRLTPVTDLTVGSDGSIYSHHRDAPFVRHWSADGTHLADIGPEGEGPGELPSPGYGGFFGDTLWVADTPGRTAEDAPLYRKDEAGMAFYVVERRAVPEGATEARWSLHRVERSGDTAWSRTLAYDPEPVPPSVADSLTGLYRPAHYTPVDAAVAGRDGTFWVGLRAERVPRVGDTPLRTWLVFGPYGSEVARLQLPARVHVLAADRANVWGTVTDDLDVPWLVRFRVVE